MRLNMLLSVLTVLSSPCALAAEAAELSPRNIQLDSTMVYAADSLSALESDGVAAENEAIRKAKAILDPEGISTYRHFIKIGIGDMYTDAILFPDSQRRDYTCLPSESYFLEQQEHRYCPHLFAEYSYRLSRRLEIGAQVDFSAFRWKDVTYQGGTAEPVSEQKQWCCNWAFMPELLIHWYDHGHWNCYSTVRLGVSLNTGSEVDPDGYKTQVGYALSPTFVGIRYSLGRFFISAEVGQHFALRDSFSIYSAFSKAFTLSAGVKL